MDKQTSLNFMQNCIEKIENATDHDIQFYKEVYDRECISSEKQALYGEQENNFMSKEEFLNYIIDFAMDTEWNDLKTREQLRALYTSWCFVFGIMVDTKECDDTLETMYIAVDLPKSKRYEFENYMVELIV